MGKSKRTLSIGAAECARRTGLTVRALRVYERCRLIEPARSANGYRLYSRKDLVRLNAIVTLKSVGLTLAQIREVLSGSPPALRRVLHLQLEALQKRRESADEGIRLVRVAIARLDSHERISILELCELARSMDMGNLQQTTREVINETIG